MEGCPFRIRRRAAFQPGVGNRRAPRRQALVQLVDKSRLPDPRFAKDDDVLPLTVLRPLPAIDECCQVDLAIDEARQVSRGDVARCQPRLA